MKTMTAALALSLAMATLTHPAFAQSADIPKGDITAFEACFIQMILDNPDNPMLDIMGPIVCGERNIPMGQTCDAIGYMLFDSRAACKADDLVFWQDQVATRAAAAIDAGRTGTGVLFDEGLARCADRDVTGDDPLDCLIEIHWRTAMEFLTADLVAQLQAAQ